MVFVYFHWMNEPVWAFRYFRLLRHQEHCESVGLGTVGQKTPFSCGHLLRDRNAYYYAIEAFSVSCTPRPTRQGLGLLPGSPGTRRTSYLSSASVALPSPGVAYWAKRTICEDGLENCIVWMFSFSSKIIWFHSSLSLQGQPKPAWQRAVKQTN